MFELAHVLLSTGEMTPEIRVRLPGVVLHESAPDGSTVGGKERPVTTGGDREFLQVIAGSDLLCTSQRQFDQGIEGFGSALSTPASLVFLRAKAHMMRLPLHEHISRLGGTTPTAPGIVVNILNGGKHAGNGLDMCEFMILPRAQTAEERTRIASEVYQDLRRLLEQRLGVHPLVGREGGFAPALRTTREALAFIVDAIDARNSGNVALAIDVAANNFCERRDGFQYMLDGQRLGTSELVAYYERLVGDYPQLAYLEDPFHEDDAEGWRALMASLGDRLMIVADDLTVTCVEHMDANEGLFNAIILKANQVGTFSGLLEAFRRARALGVTPIVSQRSGETDSPIIADIAVGLGAEFLKAGAPARERIVKYNRLMRLSEELHARP